MYVLLEGRATRTSLTVQAILRILILLPVHKEHLILRAYSFIISCKTSQNGNFYKDGKIDTLHGTPQVNQAPNVERGQKVRPSSTGRKSC